MAAEPISCPYCNSRFTPDARFASAERLSCPRCGESFPRHGSDIAPKHHVLAKETEEMDSAVNAPQCSQPTIPQPIIHPSQRSASDSPRFSNRFIAGVMVGMMAIIGVAALVFVWDPAAIRQDDWKLAKPTKIVVPWTIRFALGLYICTLVYVVVRSWLRAEQPELAAARESGKLVISDRPRWWFTVPVVTSVGLILLILAIQTNRDDEPESKPTENPMSIQTIAPAELQALAYLPDQLDFLAAVHVQELLQADKSVRQLVQLGLAVALPGINQLETLAGIRLDAIDHLVLGLGGTKKNAALIWVIQTKKPYGRVALDNFLKAGRVESFAKKPLYLYPWGPNKQATVWCAASNILVVIVRPDSQKRDMTKFLLVKPRALDAKMPASFRTLFRDRPLASGTPVWLAGHVGDAKALQAWLSLLFLTPNDMKVTGLMLSSLVKDGDKMLKLTKTLRVGFQVNRQLSLIAEFQTDRERSATRLTAILRKQKPEGLGLAVAGRPKNDRWVVLQAKVGMVPSGEKSSK